MLRWLKIENLQWMAILCLGLSNALLPIKPSLNGLFLTIAAIFILAQLPKSNALKNLINPYFLLCLLLFGAYAISISYSENNDFAMDSFSRKTPLLLFALAIFLLPKINGVQFKWLVWFFTVSNLLILAISLIESGYRWFRLGESNQITHQNLTLLVGIQTTYLALYLMVNGLLLVALFEYKLIRSHRLLILILIFFFVGILLTGSRSMYLVAIVFALYYILKKQRSTKIFLRKHFLWITTAVLAFSISIYLFSPLKERIHETFRTDFSLINQDHFEHDSPFNGVTLRLLFWKFAGEILVENRAWFFGVGIGDGQDKLEEKFYEYNVYTGNPTIGDTGYLHYNYHNQYVQTTIHIGIFGLTILILILIQAYRKILQTQGWILACIVLVYAVVFMTESAMERQFGLGHIFFWIPLLCHLTPSIETSHQAR